MKELDAIIKKYEGKPGRLLCIIEDAQKIEPRKYLERDVLEYIARKTRTSVSKIYNIITFYAFFNLFPQGEHSIVVCRGTACHTRGSKDIQDFLLRYFGFGDGVEGQQASLTTKDNKFTLKTVACFGQCALAPVVEIDGKIYSRMTQEKLKAIIKGMDNKKKKK
ncbi:MAG: NAD(P)H-dependent oxidoreductase subunit E [Candidatus Omnitrophica bacterium]|nr:NAD(P)H-dependent oxidoreductase subunit E [Candidatus Omnitrophota bacterium]